MARRNNWSQSGQNMMNVRITFDSMYMNIAKVVSERSSAQRLKVGAVIVKDNNIAAIGYNGTLSGTSNVCEDENNKTLPTVFHAEENAILHLAKTNGNALNSKMYVTHAPCINCAKMIIQSGIKEVIYNNTYRDEAGLQFLRRNNVLIKKIEGRECHHIK